MKFYHGTSDIVPIRRVLLPPIRTGNLREEWRQKDTDKVFFTNSPGSAFRFAKKACEKYGGKPVVYVVKPLGMYFHTVNNEFIADKALVLGKKTKRRFENVYKRRFEDRRYLHISRTFS